MNISEEARKAGMKENTLRSRLRRGWKFSDAIKSPVATKHGWEGSRTYHVWQGIIQRCTNKSCKAYKQYGGRGISVCDRWLDFRDFIEDVGEIIAPLTLDRIDNNGDYSPENFRIVTHKVQNRNRRDNVLVEHDGESHCLSEWAEIAGIPYGTFHYRLKHGWTFEQALNTPVGKPKSCA